MPYTWQRPPGHKTQSFRQVTSHIVMQYNPIKQCRPTHLHTHNTNNVQYTQLRMHTLIDTYQLTYTPTHIVHIIAHIDIDRHR